MLPIWYFMLVVSYSIFPIKILQAFTLFFLFFSGESAEFQRKNRLQGFCSPPGIFSFGSKQGLFPTIWVGNATVIRIDIRFWD